MDYHPHPEPLELSPWTVNLADDVATPRMFLALHVYTPPSLDATSRITSPPLVRTILLSTGRLEFSFSHVSWGVGFPLTSHCSDAIPVSLTTMDIGGDTIEGAVMDSPGSPLGPGAPWSPSGPGGPWSPWVPLFPLGPWGPRGPGGPCLPWAPGLSLSAPYSSLAVYLTGQATQGQLDFSFDVFTADYYTHVWFLVFAFWAAFVATLCFCN